MSEFEDYLHGESKVDSMTNPYDAAREAWDFQQAKIYELQKLRSLDEMTISQLAQANQVWQSKCNELQARVDEITNHVGINFDEERDDDQHSYWSGYNQAMRELNDILKGKEDEN